MSENVKSPDDSGSVVSHCYPPVLDACCGVRMFWFDKHDDRAVFIDNRCETFTHVRKDCGDKQIEVKPDRVMDFTDLQFPDNTFRLVVFDPPHVKAARGNVTKYYGTLSEDWPQMIERGFSECFRVLKPGGVLVFKWSETQISINKILTLTPEKPLFGHRVGARAKTHWVTFIKCG